MKTQKRMHRRRYTEIAVGALVTGLLIGSWSIFRTPHEPSQGGGSTIDTQDVSNNKPRKWLVEHDGNSSVAKAADVAGDGTLPAVQEVDNGPISQSIVPYLKRIAPSGSSLLSATDYPSLKGGTVRLKTPDGDVISLTVHKLSRPVPVKSITMGRAPTSLTESKAGTQFLELRTALAPGIAESLSAAGPARVQLLVSRPAGVLVTLTASAAEPGDPMAIGATDQLSDFLAKAKSVLDVPSIDTIVQ